MYVCIEELKHTDMKTYYAFAKTTESGQLINTEIKANNIKEARKWVTVNTFEYEPVYQKK